MIKNFRNSNLFLLYIFVSFIFLTVSKFFFPALAFVLVPIEVLVHEFSHALVTLIVGGSVTGFSLGFLQGYVTSSVPDSYFSWRSNLIAFSGYIGEVVIGYCIFQSSRKMYLKIMLAFMSAFIAYFCIFSESVITIIICLLFVAFVFLTFKLNLERYWYFRVFTEFIGCYLALSGVLSPVYQIGSDKSDAYVISMATGIPVFFCVSLWSAVGVLFLMLMYRMLREGE